MLIHRAFCVRECCSSMHFIPNYSENIWHCVIVKWICKTSGTAAATGDGIFTVYEALEKKISSSHKPTHHHPSAKVQSTVNKQKRSSKSAHSFLSILRTPRDTIITFMPIITLLLFILAKNFSEPPTSSWQIRRRAPLTQFPISITKSIQPTVRLICLLLTYVLTRSNGLYEWRIKLISPDMGCCCCKSKMLIGFNPEIRNTSVNVQQCVAHFRKNVCCSSSKGPPFPIHFTVGRTWIAFLLWMDLPRVHLMKQGMMMLLLMLPLVPTTFLIWKNCTSIS